MAYTNEILVGRFNRGLQKLFGIKGPAPVPQLASDLQPVFLVFAGVENLFLEGWQRFANGANVGAQGVGALSAIFLRNPLLSNVIIVIEKAWTQNGPAGTTFDIRTGNTDLGTLQQSRRLDGRAGLTGNVPVTAIVSLGTTVTPTLGILGATPPQAAAAPYSEFISTVDQEVTVAPGDLAALVGQTTNTNVFCGFVWRERALEESELK